MDPDITLAGISLEHPLMNAAGTCKTVEDVREFARSAVSAITLGSITLEPRGGNEGDVYWHQASYSVNSLGMPNGGRPYYLEHLAEMVDIANEGGKPVVVSVAGFSPDEYGQLADLALNSGADLIELNMGCPNVWSDGQQKRIASFDPPGIHQILHHISDDAKLGIKLSPYSDPGMLAEVAAVLNGHDVDYVVASNTFPNALVLDASNTPIIGVGLAGLSGAAMFPIGLGQVYQLRQKLKDSIQIVGAGGISSGAHIRAYLSVGAVAVQSSTPYWNAGCNAGVYSEILQDYQVLAPA